MTRIRLCARSAVPAGGILGIRDVAGIPEPLAVAEWEGTVHCIADTCSHQRAALSDGWVDDGSVECPLHESRFDLRTGEPDVAPAVDPVAVYRVEVADGAVWLITD